MRRRIVLEVVLAAVAFALTASAAQATTHVYMSAWNVGRIDEFRASANGALTQFGTRPENGANPWYMVMTSNARNLYVDTYTSDELEAFNATTTGALTPKTAAQGSSLPTGSRPYALAASPDNRNIYVPNYGVGGTVSIYDLAPDGSAKVHSPSAVSAGTGPSGVAVSRDGKSVYVAAQDGNIYQFNRSANGALTKKSPAFVKVKQRSDTPLPDYVVLTPNGRHLYSANYNDSSIGVFDVHPNGTLTEKASSPVTGGYGYYEIAMSPNGKSLYGASNTEGVVYQYSVLPDGSLQPKSPATVAAGGGLASVWLSADGRNAYVANDGTYSGGGYVNYDLRQFSIDAAGRLHAKTPPSVATDNYPAAVVVAPNQSPRAAFKASPAGVRRKQFDATGSKDPDGRVTRYVWRFGDGTGPRLARAKPTHRYAHAGTYAAKLTVVDNAGCSVAQIWTGQTAYCGGNRAATVHHRVTVK